MTESHHGSSNSRTVSFVTVTSWDALDVLGSLCLPSTRQEGGTAARAAGDCGSGRVRVPACLSADPEAGTAQAVLRLEL